jgi:hypothetical protein
MPLVHPLPHPAPPAGPLAGLRVVEICNTIAQNSEWDKMELGPITSIRELAFASLYEFAYENINLEELLEETYKEIEDAKF